ncbi:TIGR01777 family oxidoreductase [Vicingaceae bacterium]|nr:TIGR01777 family oxidoreductase [Vicingaceae bacterium]
MIKKPTIVIAGGTGFFGNYLINFFKKDYSIVVLTRKNSFLEDDVSYVNWDGKNKGEWLDSLEGSEVLINLSGKSINCKFTKKNKEKLLSSRIDSTKVLVCGVRDLKKPPKVFLNASAGSMYELLDAPNEETDKSFNKGFLSEMALDWEEEFFRGELAETRRLTLRISLILGKEGGVYDVLQKITKFYLGGFVGSGKQIMSWIHIEDAAKAVKYLIDTPTVEGPINFSTINPETNAIFMKKLRGSLSVPFGFPAPTIGLKLMSNVVDIEPSLVLNSVNFIPRKLVDNGFKFKYDKLEDALNALK